MKSNRFFTVKRITLDAMLVALYVLLGFWKIPIGNLLRVNLASFAVVVCAITFSPIDGLIVGLLGELLSQILGPYGLTPTTMLWVLPEATRGLLLGCMMWVFAKKQRTPKQILQGKSIVWYLLCCILTGVIASLLNTFALYVDSRMFGYYNYYMVFGVLLIRLSLAVVMSGTFGYIALPIASALKRNKIV